MFAVLLEEIERVYRAAAAAIADINNVQLPLRATKANPEFTGRVSEQAATVAAADVACTGGSYRYKTLTANTTFTFSAPAAAGLTTTFFLELTNGGAYVVTWPAAVKWTAGVAPTLTAAGVDVLGFATRDGGATWRGFVLAKDSK